MKFKGGAIIALLGVFGLIFLMGAGAIYVSYSLIGRVEKDGAITISTGSTIQQQAHMLENEGFIKSSSDYELHAKVMKISPARAGKYRLTAGMSYKELMEPLSRGLQLPVKLRFEATNKIESLARQIGEQLEADSASVVNAIKSDSLQKLYDFCPATITMMFIPNTYEMYWNTSADAFLRRMHKEYEAFWKSRDKKLAMLEMTREQVMTLASIVYGETKYSPEMPLVAGVYMNRLRIGMPLQADPTVIFAHNDLEMRRVLKVHLEIDSPYNTYKYKGLPPGPINIPSISAIDAVLNHAKTKYIYFCASENLDGTHNFAVNYNDHLKNAREYAKKLDEMGIK